MLKYNLLDEIRVIQACNAIQTSSRGSLGLLETRGLAGLAGEGAMFLSLGTFRIP
jgi:hypothetical protein